MESRIGKSKVRIAKAKAVMGEIWGLGKRRFGGDWRRRIWLFDRLIWTVVGYGVEIWGWKKREKQWKGFRRNIYCKMGTGGGRNINSRIFGKGENEQVVVEK